VKKKFQHIKIISALILLVLSSFNSYAQFYNGSNMTFGKRKVQYKNFKWNYYDHSNYQIYFYQNGQNLAIFTHQVLKDYLPQLEKDFNTQMPSNIQFIIFNTLGDLKQSNLGSLANTSYNTGGIAHIIDRKVFMYFNGDIAEFEKQVRAGACKLVIQNALGGNRLRDRVSITDDINENDWFVDGLVSYYSDNWNTKMDDDFKKVFFSGNIKKLKHVQGEYSVIIGHSVWKFIADKFGKNAIKEIVRYARRLDNPYDAFKVVLSINFKELEKEWRKYYEEYYTDYKEDNIEKQDILLSNKRKKHLIYNNINFSSDGKYITYTTNEMGLKKLYIKDLETGDLKRVYKTGYRSNTKMDNTFPVLAWHPTRPILAVAVEEKGSVKLFFYTISDNNKKNWLFLQNQQFSSLGFQKVLDMNYSFDGAYIIFSAVKDGQTDLFLWNIVSGVSVNLTNDIFNDFNPVFLNNQGDILFSSNRGNDLINLNPNNDLFRMNVFQPEKVTRMTNTTNADEIMPQWIHNNLVTYISDKNGIYNMYLGEFDSIISFVDTITHYNYFLKTKSITDYNSNIVDYDVKNNTAIEILSNYNTSLISKKTIPALSSINDGSGIETKLDNTYYRSRQYIADSLTNAVPQKKEVRQFKDVLSKDLRREFPTKYVSEMDPSTPDSVWEQIIITHYEEISEELKEDDFAPDKWKNYYVEFFINDLITQLDFSSMNYSYQQFSGGSNPIYLYSGFNILLGTGLTDLMEDYRITGAFSLSNDLVNNEYAISFSNLKKRLDKEFIFHRNTDYTYNSSEIAKLRTHEFMYKLTWPFTDYLHVSGTAILRNNKTVDITLGSLESIAEPIKNTNWLGFKGELTFDNTYQLSQNILLGTRFKIFGEYSQMIVKENRNMVVLGFDFRNYQRIHRQMIFAWRIAGSTSFGTDRLIYYMGGVDNWIVPRYNYDNQVSDEINYAYQTLATNMRGFSQNTRNGPNFIVLNTEIRLPVFRYFANRPLSSKFLNSIQLVGFADLGTAWNGLSPYSDENALYRKKYYANPMLIEVINYKEPFVLGYGLGLRFSLFGYFVRIDYGWGLEDWKIADKGWHISFNLDF
jgi:hypothetical protein